MIKYFWKDWKRKSLLEKKAINNIKIAIKRIINEASREEILSIYIKGSFIKREMKKGSDIDTILVLKTKKERKKLRELKNSFGKMSPPIHFGIRTYRELISGKRINPGNSAGSVGRFNTNLHNFKLVYGDPLDKSKLFYRSNESMLKGMIWAFKNMFLPGYQKEEFSFDELIKQTFFLIEYSEKVEGRNPPHSFKGLKDSIKDSKNIVHDAYSLRIKSSKDIKIKKEYIKKLKSYLNRLEKRKNII